MGVVCLIAVCHIRITGYYQLVSEIGLAKMVYFYGKTILIPMFLIFNRAEGEAERNVLAIRTAEKLLRVRFTFSILFINCVFDITHG